VPKLKPLGMQHFTPEVCSIAVKTAVNRAHVQTCSLSVEKPPVFDVADFGYELGVVGIELSFQFLLLFSTTQFSS